VRNSRSITIRKAAIQSRETLNYGVSKDPDCPLFYYNLARIAAEKGSVGEKGKNLTLVLEGRGNVIP
jgi:hypothetical protein